jgi:predicted dehydrogenase
MKPLKVKILGSGGAAQKHLKAFGELPDLYELTDGDADITDICTPPYKHFDQASDALERGHVIVEKPVCDSLWACDELQAEEDATGNFICPIFQYRFDEHEPFGVSIETAWRRDKSYYDGWRGQWKTALGGCLMSHGIHSIDLMIQKNEMPKEISCGMTFDGPDGLETVSSVNFHSPDRFIGTIVRHDFDTQTDCLGDSHKGYVNQFRLLHDAITTGKPPPVTLDEARQSIEVITAAYYAVFTRNAVSLPLQPSHPFYRGWVNTMKQEPYLPHGNRKNCFKGVKERLLNRHVIESDTECWLWTGALMPNGYGYMAVRGKNKYTHRAAYEEFIGPIPSGSIVRHSCDTRNCINPEHLEIGTHQDNANDKVERNRQAIGAKSMKRSTKLSESDVTAIRNDNRSTRRIAIDYDISKSQVHRIKRRAQWNHVQ